MIVTCRAAPVDILRRLTRDEAAILPEIFTRTGAPAAMQAVDDSRGDTTRFQNQSRHGVGELAGPDCRLSDRCGLVVFGRRLRHRNYPMRAFRRRMTLGMLSPSARAAK